MNSDPKDPLLLDHEADGIRELDNNLPRWWVWLFYITIAFSVFYLLYYHVLKAGPLQAAEYDNAMKVGDVVKSAAMGRFESTMGALQPSAEPGVIDSGREQYMKMCAPCHRPDGGGLVGPNLCDDYWIHGTNYTDTLKVIWNGVPEKGMVTWKGLLKPSDIQSIASFVHTLRGTKPPNPKPREDQAQPEKPNIFE